MVFDGSHERVSMYDRADGFVRAISLNSDEAGLYLGSAWARGSRGVFVYRFRYDPTGSGPFPRRSPQTARLTLHNGTGALVSGPVDFDGGYTVDLPGFDVVASFANIPAVAVLGNRIVFSPAIEYELTTLDENLRPVGRVVWPGMTEPVTESEVEWLRHEREKQWEEFPNTPQELIDQIIDAEFAPKLIPDNRPAIGSVVLDRQGRTWVSRFEPMQPYVPGRAEAWHVLDPGGTPVGRLTLPMGAELMAVDGDRVMLLTTDELDVQHIAIFRVIKGEGK